MSPEVSRSRLGETVDALATGRISRKEFVRRATLLGLSASAIGSLLAAGAGATSNRRKKRLKGPLRVHPDNPRYFTDGPGKPPVYLAGTNTWGTLQDGFVDGWFYSWDTTFDFDGFLDLLSVNDLNYIRFWLYETALVTYYGDISMFAPEHPVPLPWRRTGPGTALDGGPKFDLTKFDDAYFKRLKERVGAAGDRGIYVSVMLFEGWSVTRRDGHDAWPGHPFNVQNNVNGIDGNPNGDTSGGEIHTLQIPEVVELQQRYVRKVVDTVNHFDNVLYEIANETHAGFNAPAVTLEWQYHMTDVIRSYEAGLKKRHPVYISSVSPFGNDLLYESPADAIAPAWRDTPVSGIPDWNHWLDDPPATDGQKVLIFDTDHGTFTRFHEDLPRARAWAWKAFTRGYNPSLLARGPYPGLAEGQRALGDTRRLARRLDLATVMPQDALSSTGYCLADPGSEYVVYQPGSGAFDVSLAAGSYAME